MNRENLAWRRLAEAARRAPDDRGNQAPLGFATRVAALAWSSAERPVAALFERFSLRAMAVACLLAAAAVAANYSSVRRLFDDRTTTTPSTDDPTAELVDLAAS